MAKYVESNWIKRGDDGDDDEEYLDLDDVEETTRDALKTNGWGKRFLGKGMYVLVFSLKCF